MGVRPKVAPGKSRSTKAPMRLPSGKRTGLAHRAHGGAYYLGKSEKLLASRPFERFRGRVQLILTSPPYPLNAKKSYGNLSGDRYLEWFSSLAPIFSDLLTNDGSIVIELGNSWEPGRPVQSVLHLKALLDFAQHKTAGLRLIQQFVCYNPSRLPTPASWVTVSRWRTVDSFTHVWWLAKTDHPKADNSRVLRPYSGAMEALLKRKAYNAGKRPSEHVISKKGFLRNNGGSIAHNLLEVEPMDTGRKVRFPNAFSFANNASNDPFHVACRRRGIVPHPARMPQELAAFFIQFLTDRGDFVLDPFGGTNTTGFVAARLGRRWITIDAQRKYATQSKLRFSRSVFTSRG